MGQIGSADETPIYFNMPSCRTVDDGGAKSMVIQTWGYKKIHFTVMLAVYVCGGNTPLYIILYHKTVAKEQLLGGIIVRCQPKRCWITNELTKDWLLVEWNRRPGVLLGKQGMLILDAYKGHLTLETEATSYLLFSEHTPCSHT